jgi:membrane protein
MKRRVLGGLTIKELARRIWRAANEHDVFGAAAKLAYYFLLALFPMLIFLTSLVGFLPGVQERILQALSEVAPRDAMEMVRATLNDVVSKRSSGLLSFGVLATVWAASSGVGAMMDALNIAYIAQSYRSIWKQRLIALGMTIMLAVFIISSSLLLMFGDRLSRWLAALAGFGHLFIVAWSLLDDLLGLALLLIGIETLYYFAPNIKQPWRWITPGALFAAVGLIIVSKLFSYYLSVGPSYSATYGSLGAVIVLMLWLYLVGLVLILGGEINGQIERAAQSTVPASTLRTANEDTREAPVS